METVRIESILAATDFHDVADVAIEHATQLAIKFAYPLHILHVYSKKHAKISEEEAQKKVEQIAAQVKAQHNIDVTPIFKVGDPVDLIKTVSKQVKASYLTMGTRGKTGVDYILGSYAAKIVQNSDVPVLVTQKKREIIDYKNIILPIDNTTETKQKMKWAILFARKWDAKVHIFTRKTSDDMHMERINSDVLQIKKFFQKANIDYIEVFSSDSGATFGKQALQYAIEAKGDLFMATTQLRVLMPGFFSISLFSKETMDETFLNEVARIPILCINPKDFNLIIGGL